MRVPMVNYEDAQGKIKEAFDAQIKKSGSITNMKRVLLQSYEAYSAYMGWYTLYARMQEFLGERASMIFSHAISTTNGCLLCSLFFIKDLRDMGLDPNNIEFDDKENLLVEFGQQIVKDPNGVSDELFEKLRKYFSDEELVVLVAFAGQMMATNNFNAVLQVEVDERLTPYKGEFKPETWRKG